MLININLLIINMCMIMSICEWFTLKYVYYIQEKILTEAVRAGDVDIITSLLESGVDPNIKVSIYICLERVRIRTIPSRYPYIVSCAWCAFLYTVYY